MKKSEYDFSIPNRQSYIAILLILGKTVNVVVRQLIPVLLIILVGGSKQKGDYIIYMVIGIALITMVYSVINFFRTYFYIEDNQLILHTGILNQKKMTIPFERIQTINFEQNIIHQFFSVLRLKIDTAGSEKNEFEFHAMEKEKAYALQELIMEGKALQPINDSDLVENPINRDAAYQTIMQLSVSDLLKVGFTENHIRSGGLILLFGFWIYQNLKEVGVDVDEYSEQIPEWELGLYTVIVFFTFISIISVLISLVRTIIKNYDLKFLRSTKGFKIVSGLFTKREVSALDHKIQHISWSDNLLKRLLGYKDLSLNQASSTELKTKQNINIPGCNMKHINQVITTLFGPTDLKSFRMTAIDKKYFLRFATIVIFLLVIVVSIGFWIGEVSRTIPVMLLAAYAILNRYLSYRKKAFGYNNEILYIRGGIFGEKAEILPMFKIQALEIHQSPYQTRNELCSLSLFTASGRLKIPYIPLSAGQHMVDIFLYKVEADHRKWM